MVLGVARVRHDFAIKPTYLGGLYRIKDKANIIISIDAEKVFGEICHPLMIKGLNKLRIEGNFLDLMKNIFEKPTNIIILNDEILKVFP